MSHELLTESNGCPAPNELAAFIDQKMNDIDRAAIERHLATCPICLDALAAACAAASAPTAEVSPPLIKRLERLGPPKRRRVEALAVVGWALRAAAVLAVSFAGYQIGTSTTRRAPADQHRPAAFDPTFGFFDDSSFGMDGELLVLGLTTSQEPNQ